MLSCCPSSPIDCTLVGPTTLSLSDTPLKSFTRAIAPADITAAGTKASARLASGLANPTAVVIASVTFFGIFDRTFNIAPGSALATEDGEIPASLNAWLSPGTFWLTRFCANSPGLNARSRFDTSNMVPH